jgi:hypothetical protein
MYLRELERHSPERPILLFVDHGSIHKSQKTLRGLEALCKKPADLLIAHQETAQLLCQAA